MSVNTGIYILTYSQGKFEKAFQLENFQFMRFDDGIYGQVWDIENQHYPEIKKINMDRYSLNEAEFDLLQLYNFPCSDLYETATDSEEVSMNFTRIPTDKRTKPSTLKAILLKIYQKEKQQTLKFEKDYFVGLTDKSKNEISKPKPGLKGMFGLNPSAQSRLEEIEKSAKEYLLTKPVPEFLHLLGFMLGYLTALEEKDEEMQIVFCHD
jgi:hypothetical protein